MYDSGGFPSQWRKDFFPPTYDNGKFGYSYIKNKKVNPYLVPCQKMSSIYISDLNIKKELKLFKEKKILTMAWSARDNTFMTQNINLERKIDKFYCIQIKTSCASKYIIIQMNRKTKARR